MKTKLTFYNENCGHTFERFPGYVIDGNTDCIICGVKERTKNIIKWSKTNSDKWRETATEWETYKSKVYEFTRLNYKKNKKQINPTNLPRGKAGVDGAYHLDHKVPVRFCFENGIPPVVCADPSNLQMVGWKENIGSRNHIKGSIPVIFFQYIPNQELILNMLKLIKDKIFKKSKLFHEINGVTASLFDEMKNIAIFVIPISKPYANQKIGKQIISALENTDITYIVIFEDELLQQTEKVLSKLTHLSNQNLLPLIHGRKCEIREIDNKIKREFLNTHHIQGSDNSQIKYGAFYENKLVAVMTFSKPRTALGKVKHSTTKKYEFELVRFATDNSIRVVGIAGKLLSHFKRNNKWKVIYSYADIRWSSGKLYETLGFDLENISTNQYFYIVDNKRKHRYKYRKDMLKNTLPNYDPDKTEYENMEDAGYWRVWGCGTLKYVMNNK